MATRTDKLITIFEGQDKVTPTQKKVGDGFDSVGKKGEKFGGAMKGATSSLVGLAAQLGIVASIAGTVSFGAMSLNAAIAAEEVQNKFSVVFGAVSEDAENMAANLAKDFGLSKTAAKDLLSGTGDLLTGFGFTDEAALVLSNDVQELAVDLASFNNLQGGAEQASQILTKALLGERDALTSLGVKVSAADVEARLAAQGKDKLTGSARLAAEAEATFALALEQTGKAQGDFARSADSAANKQRILSARFEDLQAEIGNKLLPIWNEFLDVAVEIIPVIGRIVEEGFEKLSAVITSISDFVNNNAGTVRALLIGFAVAIGVFLVPALFAWAFAAGAAAVATIAAALPMIAIITAITLVVAAIVWLIENFDQVKETVSDVFSSIGEFIGNVIGSIVDTIKNGIQSAIDFVVGGFDKFKNMIGDAFNGIKNGVSNVITSIKDAIQNFFSNVANVGSNIANVFKQLINTVVDKINDTLEFEIKILGRSISVNLPDIPRLQTGTNFFEGGPAVMNEVGPEMAILPRGTRIKSFDGNDVQTVGDGGGTTINNYNTFYEKVDMNRVANKLAFQINQ